MSNISYEIQDNNNWLLISDDSQGRTCGIDIHYHEEIGYFFDDNFTPSEIEYFGFKVLEDIKATALRELNKPPTQEA